MPGNFIIIRVDNSGGQTSQGEVTAPVNRKVRYLVAGDRRAPLRAFSLKLLSAGSDCHIFRDRAYLKLDIRCSDFIIGVEDQALQGKDFESLRLNVQLISVGLQLGEDKASVFSCLRGSRFVAAGA